jgi:predicted nucleic acid-binding protein
MVLIDTSVWIRAFSNVSPYRKVLDRLLGSEEAAGHELVYGELLIGDSGGRSKFLLDYLLIHQAKSVPHSDVVELVRLRKLHGKGAGWIDIHLLASALAGGMKFWTADPRLDILAIQLGVAFELPAQK